MGRLTRVSVHSNVLLPLIILCLLVLGCGHIDMYVVREVFQASVLYLPGMTIPTGAYTVCTLLLYQVLSFLPLFFAPWRNASTLQCTVVRHRTYRIDGGDAPTYPRGTRKASHTDNEQQQ